jgi:hypothetical protein
MLQSLSRSLDLVIEDGSHMPQHQVACRAETFPFVRSDGLYVLEDLPAAVLEHLRATGLTRGDSPALLTPDLNP